MFDMNKIGKKISSLRKQSGLTQMELADRLGISFQAVSNWERGNTMPDISKLPELAEIFGCSMEEILGDERKAKIVQDLAVGQTPVDVKAEDLADIAPIVSDEQFKQTYEQAETNGMEMDFETLMSIVPYLDDDVLEDLIKNFSKYGFTIKQACSIAPYLNDDVLDEMANSIVTEGTSVKDISELAPYISEETLSKLAEKYISKGISVYELTHIAPYMDSEDISKLVAQYVAETGDISRLDELAPYMDDDDITKIAADYIKNGGKIDDVISSVAPYVDMNELFKLFYKK